jgi:carbonic anhydrase
VQVDFRPGNTLVVDGAAFTLRQMHFHAPSENTIVGRSFPMEAHFVHADAEGHLLVLALMFKEGSANPPAALDNFINSGWELGAQATASAKTGDKGMATAGAMPVSPGIWLYQLTDDGLAVELTAKGTKYYKDDELN